MESFYEDAPDQLHQFRKQYGGGHIVKDDKDPFDQDIDMLQAQKYRELMEYQRTGIRPPKASPDPA